MCCCIKTNHRKGDGMNQLTKYDAARYALSVAVEVDEVKDIRDKAEAMAAYARQAKDTELVQWATEIKVRAERRAGQMLAEMPKASGSAGLGRPKIGGNTVVPPKSTDKTLADIGITKNESSRWQKLAAVSEEQFEHAVAAAKEVAGEVTTAAMLRAAKADDPKAAETTKPANPKKAKQAPSVAEQKPEVTDDGAPDAAELEASRIHEEANAKTIAFMLASDEPLADLAAKNTQLEAQIKQLELRIAGLQNANNEHIRTIKSLRNQIKKVQA